MLGLVDGAVVGASLVVGSLDGSLVGVSAASGTLLEEVDPKRLLFEIPTPTPAMSTNAAAMETGAIHFARGLKAIICALSFSVPASLAVTL